MAICAGDGWLEQGANLILFGPPGGGKSHLAAAIGLALIENGWRVLFTRTSDLVQRLQVARRELTLEAAVARLDKYHLLILDDMAYVTKDQAETSVLFELISARYEQRSMLITANQPFGEWNRIFPDPAMTLAAVDRLVHHATIFEMNVAELPTPHRRPATYRCRTPADLRDNQDGRAGGAPRQSERHINLASDKQTRHPCRARQSVLILIDALLTQIVDATHSGTTCACAWAVAPIRSVRRVDREGDAHAHFRRDLIGWDVGDKNLTLAKPNVVIGLHQASGCDRIVLCSRQWLIRLQGPLVTRSCIVDRDNP